MELKLKKEFLFVKNLKEKYLFLQNQLLKACFNKYPPSINRKRIDKIANQIRYLEKFIQPEVKETAK